MPEFPHLMETWTAIQEFGFEPDATVISDGGSGLSCDLGQFRLSAGQMVNLYCREIVQFSAVYQTPNSMGMLDFEMPKQVESLEQCAAWIAWHFKQHGLGRQKLLSPTKASFLTVGLQHQGTLPWVRDMAAYAARPQCSAERAWMKVALNALKANLSVEKGAGDVGIWFDGQVMTFSGSGWVVPVPAKGDPWLSRYQIRTENFSKFPSRLMNEQIHISVWKEHLHVANWRYDGVTTIDFKSPDVAVLNEAGEPTLDKHS